MFITYRQVPLMDKIEHSPAIFRIISKIPSFYKIFTPSFVLPKNPKDHKVERTSTRLFGARFATIKLLKTPPAFCIYPFFWMNYLPLSVLLSWLIKCSGSSSKCSVEGTQMLMTILLISSLLRSQIRLL